MADHQNHPQAVRVPPGLLVQYYSDLSSGMLPPENMRVENLQYRLRVDPTGLVTFATPAVQIISMYNFAIRRVYGSMMQPLLAGAAPALVNFNIREQGRNFDVFKVPVSMASILNSNGPNLAEWDGVYICIPGTQLSVNFSVDRPRWQSLVAAQKEFVIQVVGDYVICRS